MKEMILDNWGGPGLISGRTLKIVEPSLKKKFPLWTADLAHAWKFQHALRRPGLGGLDLPSEPYNHWNQFLVIKLLVYVSSWSCFSGWTLTDASAVCFYIHEFFNKWV